MSEYFIPSDPLDSDVRARALRWAAGLAAFAKEESDDPRARRARRAAARLAALGPLPAASGYPDPDEAARLGATLYADCCAAGRYRIAHMVNAALTDLTEVRA